MSTVTHRSLSETFVQNNKAKFLAELLEFLRIPSISTLPEHCPDVHRAAVFVADALRAAGLENVALIPTERHPLVYADWLHAPGKPTVLCYGHYDVQPPDPLELWVTPPFEPSIREGNIYARGAADDKGQMYMHIKAVETLLETAGALPVNVRFLVEGEEEIGGKSISQYVREHADRLQSDVALVSDTALYAEGLPTLCVGLRGMAYMELEATGPSRDLHSGNYGGVAPNAVFGLIEFLAKCKDANGTIQIPGFYDSVTPAGAVEKDSWASLPFNEEEFLRNEVGSRALTGEREHSVLERIWARPAFDVHGIAGGFTAAGQKTVIPAKATAKVSFRLVPDQDPAQCIALFRDFIAANTPAGIELELRVLGSSAAVSVSPDHPAMGAAARAFSAVWGKPVVFTRSGVSIPVVGDFARSLGIPTVLMGFGLPDDGLHSPNEKYRLENFYAGIMTIAAFFQELGK